MLFVGPHTPVWATYQNIHVCLVYEHVLGENKFTFVEQCLNPQSVTILLKAPNKHTLQQTKVNT